MKDANQDGRASAGVELVRTQYAGDSRPSGCVMTIMFEKEAGVSFADGGRLLFWLVRAVEEQLAAVDPSLALRWTGDGFRVGSREADAAAKLSALGFEPIEGELSLDYETEGGDPCFVLVDGPETIRLGVVGELVRLWRDERGTK